jgi:hypothetical protein
MAAKRVIRFSFEQQRSELLEDGSMMHGGSAGTEWLPHIGKLRQPRE